MLQNTLLTIKSNTRLREINKDRQDRLFNALSKLKRGQYLYPGLIVRYTGLSLEESYEILSAIEKMGIIERVFIYVCPRCEEVEYFNSLNEVDFDLYCKSCGYSESENIYEKRNILQALKIIFRVIKE